MECPVCLERYTSDASMLPKVMPCGHFTCAGCLRRVQSCPKCRKEFAGSVDTLPTAFDVIDPRERSGDDSSGWWCTECLSPAAVQCRAKHLIVRVEEALRRQAAKLAPLASEAVRGLEDAVQAAAEEPARLALQLLADGDAPAECELTVRRGGSAVGAQWRLEEGGAADGLDRALLCKLAVAGKLLNKAKASQAPPQAAVLLEAPIIPKLDVQSVSFEGIDAHGEKKKELLQRVRRHRVQRMENLFCHKDPVWSLQLLEAAAPSLEALQLCCPRLVHLLVVHSAPRLQRLHASCVEDGLIVNGQPVLLPALAAPSSLQWLRVCNLPRATLQSLLRAHAASLRTLVLSVGTPGNEKWPDSCRDLDALLRDCGLAALTKLQLVRVSCIKHSKPGCKGQIKALRRVLPATTVQCSKCDETFPVEKC